MDWRSFLSAVIALASAACGGRSALVSFHDDRSDGGNAGASTGAAGMTGAGSSTGGSSGTGGSTIVSRSVVEAARARCDLAHGPAVEIATPDEEEANLIGDWVLCPPPDAQPQTMFGPAIRFESNGRFETLTINDEGGLEPGMGVLAEGQWATQCSSPTANGSELCPGTGFDGILNRVHTVGGDDSPAGCFVGPITFERSPTRAHVIDWPQLYCTPLYTGDPFDFWLVPLP